MGSLVSERMEAVPSDSGVGFVFCCVDLPVLRSVWQRQAKTELTALVIA
jgi:hypothetical protein